MLYCIEKIFNVLTPFWGNRMKTNVIGYCSRCFKGLLNKMLFSAHDNGDVHRKWE